MGTSPQSPAHDALAYKRDAWSLILANGAVVGTKDWSDDPEYIAYYHQNINADWERTEECWQSLRSGIDWERTSEPANITEKIFTGTHASYDEWLEALTGTLVTMDGHEYPWAVAVPDNLGFGGVIKLLSSAPPLDAALCCLEERITHPDRDWTLPLELRLP